MTQKMIFGTMQIITFFQFTFTNNHTLLIIRQMQHRQLQLYLLTNFIAHIY